MIIKALSEELKRFKNNENLSLGTLTSQEMQTMTAFYNNRSSLTSMRDPESLAYFHGRVDSPSRHLKLSANSLKNTNTLKKVTEFKQRINELKASLKVKEKEV